VAGLIPDNVNPCSHGERSIRGKIPNDIRETVETEPQNFVLVNRGSTILSSRVHFNE